MMRAAPPERRPGPGNVVDLSAYRRRRSADANIPLAPSITHEAGSCASVYVDLDSEGHLSYGLSRADIDNALSLLGPTLYLADQLLKIAVAEEIQ